MHSWHHKKSENIGHFSLVTLSLVTFLLDNLSLFICHLALVMCWRLWCTHGITRNPKIYMTWWVKKIVTFHFSLVTCLLWHITFLLVICHFSLCTCNMLYTLVHSSHHKKYKNIWHDGYTNCYLSLVNCHLCNVTLAPCHFSLVTLSLVIYHLAFVTCWRLWCTPGIIKNPKMYDMMGKENCHLSLVTCHGNYVNCHLG